MTVKYGIRGKILTAFILFSLLPLLALGVIAYGSLEDVGEISVNDSTSALEAQAESNLKQLAEDNAAIIDAKFVAYESAIDQMATYATNIFANRNDFQPIPTYYHNPAAVSYDIPGLTNDPRYGSIDISFDVSMFKLAADAFREPAAYLGGTEPDFDWSNLNPGVGATINATAHMDTVYRSVYRENPSFGWVYIGTEDGMFRGYPWSTYVKSYDPRVRGWYTPWTEDADDDGYCDLLERAANTDPNLASSKPMKLPGDIEAVYWDPPYIDAGGLGVMITGSRGVYNSSTGELIGVIGADVTIGTINTEILSIEVGANGHAFLIDDEAHTIAHKDFSDWEPDLDWTEVNLDREIYEFETETQSFHEALSAMTEGDESGVWQADYEEGGARYIAYAPIATTGYIVGIVIPREEVTEPIDATERSIRSSTEEMLITILVIDIVAIAAVILIGVILANRIVKPIKRLVETADAITAGRIDQEQLRRLGEDRSDEIGHLTNAFEQMLKTSRADLKRGTRGKR